MNPTATTTNFVEANDTWEADTFMLNLPIKDAPDGTPFRPYFMTLLKSGATRLTVSAPVPHRPGEQDWRDFLEANLPATWRPVTLSCDRGHEGANVLKELGAEGRIVVRFRAPYRTGCRVETLWQQVKRALAPIVGKNLSLSRNDLQRAVALAVEAVNASL